MSKTVSRPKPSHRIKRFQYRSTAVGDQRLTHYLFRYPAKFHPPVARELVLRFSQRGDLILDPFVGSGGLLVEAMVLGRHSIGIDVDPIAIEVARTKLLRLDMSELQAVARRLLNRLERYERRPEEYRRRMHVDLSRANYRKQLRSVNRFVPDIPEIEHWFRRYVIIDLARIIRSIRQLAVRSKYVSFFEVVFASIIRNSSNADPVPVSGLEVTAHMRRLDQKGREINPFALFRRAMKNAVAAAEELNAAAPRGVQSKLIEGSATNADRLVRKSVDAVITSPPYQGAVDYYRRHKLEMYWLGMTTNEQERRRLLDKYIGRVTVPGRLLDGGDERKLGPLATVWAARMATKSRSRAAGFVHYVRSMSRMFEEIAKLMRPGAPAIFVVGNSTWSGLEVPTADLLQEAAAKHFTLTEISAYPIKNRYMSYTRHNGANIRREFVLVMQRTHVRLPRRGCKR